MSVHSKTHSARLLCGAAAIALTVPTLAAAQTAPATPATPVAAAPDEILVTANRRQERQQDVPIAITVLSPERLVQQGITREQDLQASIPSLVVGPNGQGSRDSQSFTLRGMGASFQASPGVAVYLNEVPLPGAIALSQQGGPGNFVDIENLQVLAGPQGTLFGRNTTGGAVLIVPKRPTNELGGWLRAEAGNYKRAVIEGAINLPLIDDKVMIRVAGAHHSRDGYTEDLSFRVTRDNVNWYSGRIGLLIKPTDGISNYTMAYLADSDNRGSGVIHRGFNIAGLTNVGFCTDGAIAPGSIAVPCDVYRAVTAQALALGPRRTATSLDSYQKTQTWGVTNTTDIAFGDTVKLRNIVSYQRMKLRFSYDGDGTILQQYDNDPTRTPPAGRVTLPVIGVPVTYFNNTAATDLPRDDLEQFTEELQLQGSALDRKLDWTIGGFLFDQRPRGPQGTRSVVYCPAAFTGFCDANSSVYGTTSLSKALYAQATVDLGLLTPALDRLRFTAGYRHTWDTIRGFASLFSRNTANPAEAVCPAVSPTPVPYADAVTRCRFSAELKTDAPTWTVGLDYKLSPNVMVFGKVSRGYKAGGFNQYAVFANTQVFLPETVTSYEAGIKSDFTLADMRGRLNITGYHADYKGIQRASGDFNPITFASGAKTVNPDARINGIEIEAMLRPTRGFEIGGNFSLTDAKYTKAPPGGFICQGGNPSAPASCQPFQYVAKYIWSAFASYEQELGSIGTLAAFVNYSHTSSQNTEALQPISRQPGAVLEPFGLLSASLDLRNVGGSPVDIGLFGTNLTDETYRISNTDVFQEGSLLSWATIYGEPRMYGVRVRVHFGGER